MSENNRTADSLVRPAGLDEEGRAYLSPERRALLEEVDRAVERFENPTSDAEAVEAAIAVLDLLKLVALEKIWLEAALRIRQRIRLAQMAAT